MLVVMRSTSSEDDLSKLKQYLVERDYDFHQSTGANRVIIGIIGDTAQLDMEALKALPGVLAVFKIPEE
jgi:copper homeostasis protein CutC